MRRAGSSVVVLTPRGAVVRDVVVGLLVLVALAVGL